MDLKLLVKNDLNLLVTLQVLLEEQNVSRAAERLFLTQPAISKALSRLREVFDDPLFTRSSRGLIPTPLALSLQIPLQQMLNQTAELFQPEAFDPATYQGEISLAISEALDMILTPLIIETLVKEAPGLVLHTRSHSENQLESLERGEVDFVISLEFSSLPSGFSSQTLFSDKPAAFVAKNHPLVSKLCGAEDLLLYQRISLHFPDMDRYMFSKVTAEAEIGFDNWPEGLETENLITALVTLSKTDMILPCPEFFIYFSMQPFSFTRLKFSESADISFNYCLVTHQRTKNSAAHQWLKQLVQAKAEEIDAFIHQGQ